MPRPCTKVSNQNGVAIGLSKADPDEVEALKRPGFILACRAIPRCFISDVYTDENAEWVCSVTRAVTAGCGKLQQA